VAYSELVDRLRGPPDPVTVGAFPDGSVDDYYRLRNGDTTVDSRSAFAAAITEGVDSFGLDHVTTEPGGQAVNAARQAAALGDEVTLVGHLDHPIFDFGTDVETVSMGAPARVRVCLFERDDVMLVEESADLSSWRFETLRDALGERTSRFLERDALCCTNWGSTPGLGSALREVASLDPDGGVFCVDPGPLTTAVARDLLDVIGALEDAYDVVVSVNGDEALRCAAVTDGADPAAPTDYETIEAVRTAAGVTGVVVHAQRAAVAATPEGRVSVPTLDVTRSITETGAGDRFSAALARSLANGWDWELALSAGNACAAHYVSGAGTATRERLREHVQAHAPR
jgi:sugar/nucleoside kinase (ribokinase family)